MEHFFSEDSVFMQMLFRISDIIVLNVIFLITCLPVFTIGTALTSITYTAMTSIRYEDGYIAKKYFKAFKENFKQSTLAWLIMLVVGGVLFFDVYFWITLWTTQRMTMSQIMIVVSVIMAFVYLMAFVWLFPIMSKFQNTIKKNIWNSLALAVRHFPWTLLLCATAVAVVLLTYLNFYFLVFMVVAGFGVLAYAYAFLFQHIFKLYIEGEPSTTLAEAAEDVPEPEEEVVSSITDGDRNVTGTDKDDSSQENTNQASGDRDVGTIKRKGNSVQYINAFEDEDEA